MTASETSKRSLVCREVVTTSCNSLTIIDKNCVSYLLVTSFSLFLVFFLYFALSNSSLFSLFIFKVFTSQLLTSSSSLSQIMCQYIFHIFRRSCTQRTTFERVRSKFSRPSVSLRSNMLKKLHWHCEHAFPNELESIQRESLPRS